MAAESAVMRARAAVAERKTVRLECRMAMIAAMKKVLSPSSETRIMLQEARKACVNPEVLRKRFGLETEVEDFRSLTGGSRGGRIGGEASPPAPATPPDAKMRNKGHERRRRMNPSASKGAEKDISKREEGTDLEQSGESRLSRAL